jgi:hypothetical protein
MLTNVLTRRNVRDPAFKWPLVRWVLLPPQWRSSHPGADSWHSELVPEGEPQRRAVPVWEPLKEVPLLYEEAVALDLANPLAILGWINRRGNLWWPAPDETIRLQDVREELRVLHQAAQLSSWLRNPVGSRKPPSSMKLLQLSTAGRAWARRFDVRWRKYYAGWAILGDTLAHCLEKETRHSMFVLPSPASALLRRGRDRIEIPRPVFGATLVPRSLAGVLWLQLARDVASLRELRQCPGCAEWFIPKRSDHQWHRRCFMRLKMRGYRSRK